MNSTSISQEPVFTEDRKSQVIQNIEQTRFSRPAARAPIGFTLSLFIIAASITGFSFVRYAGLQKENFILSDQVRKLDKSIQALEEENKELALKSERAEKERQKLQDAVNSYKKENESLQFNAKKNETKVNSVVEEKTYLEDILISKTKEIEQLKRGASSETPAGVPQELIQKLNQKDEEIKRLNEQNKVLNEKLQKLYQTASSLETTIADTKKAMDSQYSSAVDLGSITVNNPSSPVSAVTEQPAERKPDTRFGTKKQGRVLAINEDHGFVVVDIGKVDGVKNGMELYLKRNGETFGTLSVLEIRDVMTACNIKNISSGKKIEINDQVSLQK